MNKKKFLAGLFVLILALFIVFAGLLHNRNNKKYYSAVIYPELYRVQTTVDGTMKKIYVKPQQKINKGQLIAEIEVLSKNKTAAAKTEKPDVAGALIRLKKAEEKYENAASMYKDGIITPEKYDEILAGLKTAQENYKTVKKQEAAYTAEMNKTEIRKIYAPTNGVVESNILTQGSYIKTGDDILHLNLDTKKVTAYVDKKTSLKLEPGQNVIIKVPGHKNKSFNGTIDYISSYSTTQENSKQPVYAVYISFDSNINSSVFTPTKDVSVCFLKAHRSIF